MRSISVVPFRRRAVAVTGVICGALAAAGIAYAVTGPNVQLASQNRIYGGGHVTVSPGDVRDFAIDAHANGADAYGDIEYGGAAHAQHEHVTCLNVSGNAATVGAIVTQADRPISGWWVEWVVQDNGGLLSSTPDAVTFQGFGPPGDPGFPAGFPYVCPTPPDDATTRLGGFMPLDGGDIVVHAGSS